MLGVRKGQGQQLYVEMRDDNFLLDKWIDDMSKKLAPRRAVKGKHWKHGNAS